MTCTHLALFLFTQLYVRQPSKPVADDMWVDNSKSPQANNTPSSPPILTSPTKRLSVYYIFLINLVKCISTYI